MHKLENTNTVFTFKPDANMFQISGYDLRDKYNEPTCYNKTKRSVKRAWAALEVAWNDQMNMYEACRILQDNGVRMHTYCAVD